MPIQEAVRWNIEVSQETDRSLRSFLTSQGMNEDDRSKFIEQAILSHVFRRTIDDIHTRNLDADSSQLEQEIEAAIQEVRAETRSYASTRRHSS